MIYNSSLSNCNYINIEEDCNSICRSSRKWQTSGRSSSCPCCIGKWRTCPTTFQLRRTRSTHWELLREDRSWFLFQFKPPNRSMNKGLNGPFFGSSTSAVGFVTDPFLIGSASSCCLTDEWMTVFTFVRHHRIVADGSELGFAKIRIARYWTLDGCSFQIQFNRHNFIWKEKKEIGTYGRRLAIRMVSKCHRLDSIDWLDRPDRIPQNNNTSPRNESTTATWVCFRPVYWVFGILIAKSLPKLLTRQPNAWQSPSWRPLAISCGSPQERAAHTNTNIIKRINLVFFFFSKMDDT